MHGARVFIVHSTQLGADVFAHQEVGVIKEGRVFYRHHVKAVVGAFQINGIGWNQLNWLASKVVVGVEIAHGKDVVAMTGQIANQVGVFLGRCSSPHSGDGLQTRYWGLGRPAGTRTCLHLATRGTLRLRCRHDEVELIDVVGRKVFVDGDGLESRVLVSGRMKNKVEQLFHNVVKSTTSLPYFNM